MAHGHTPAGFRWAADGAGAVLRPDTRIPFHRRTTYGSIAIWAMRQTVGACRRNARGIRYALGREPFSLRAKISMADRFRFVTYVSGTIFQLSMVR